MADNILTYILELQDKISPKLKVINISNDKMLEKWSEIQVKMNAARKSMSDTGNSIGSLNEKIAALRMQREWIPGSNTAAITNNYVLVKFLGICPHTGDKPRDTASGKSGKTSGKS